MTEQASTLSRLLRHAAAKGPGHAAIVAGGRRTTYSEFEAAVTRLASGLLSRGLQPGDRVAVLLSNCEEFLYTYLACSRLGLVFVPLNPRLAQAEAEAILERSTPSVLILEEEFDRRDRRPGLEALKERLTAPAVIATIEGAAPAAIWFPTLFATAADAEIDRREVAVSGDDPAVIIFTSGTTGQPKGVVVTNKGLCAYADAAARVGLFLADDRILIQVPLAVAAGSVIQVAPALRVGATLVLLDIFKAPTSLELIEAERVTTYVGPPAILILQLRAPNFPHVNLGSLRHLITGAAPVPAELARDVIEQMHVRLTNSYGATETGGLVTYMPADAPPDVAAESCGVPLPGYDVRIVDDMRMPLTQGQVGEVSVQGPSIMAGYYNDEEETRAALDDEGRWYSGDLGLLDERGHLRLVGRKKEMYIRGGFNVYPGEVEAALQRHPEIVIAAVAGYPDPVLGEKGRAFVVARPGHALTPTAIRDFCALNVADYKVPDDVVFLEQLPLAGPGKVDRRALRELAAAADPG